MRRAPKLISLFTGAGGMDYGFEKAGFKHAAAVELDAACIETLRHNRPTWKLIHRDVAKVETDELLGLGQLGPGELDLLCGGPPCQPFSKLGYWARGDSKRLEDPRADTIDSMLRLTEGLRPKVLVLENVAGFAFEGKDEALQKVHQTLARIRRKHGVEYRVRSQLMRAADYGVPQIRDRLFIIASTEGEFRFPSPTHAARGETSSGLEPYLTAWDAFADLGNDRSDLQLSARGRWAALLPSIPEGDNYLFHTDRGEGLPLFGWRRRYWSFLLKLAKDRPSWTIPASPGPAIGPFHWDSRRLSMRELCQLQSFPKDVVIPGPIATVQKQVGNAVPSLLTEILGREIRHQLLGGPRPTKPLALACERAKVPPPPAPSRRAAPMRLEEIPPQYWPYIDTDTSHPGTGRGRRAATWAGEQLSLG